MEKEKIINEFYNAIVWEKQYKSGDEISSHCPICQTTVVIEFYGKYQESSIIHCQTQGCLKITSRGL